MWPGVFGVGGSTIKFEYNLFIFITFLLNIGETSSQHKNVASRPNRLLVILEKNNFLNYAKLNRGFFG